MDNALAAIEAKIWGEVDRKIEKGTGSTDALQAEMIKTQMGLIRTAIDTARIRGAKPVEKELREIERTMELIDSIYKLEGYAELIKEVRAIRNDTIGIQEIEL